MPADCSSPPVLAPAPAMDQHTTRPPPRNLPTPPRPAHTTSTTTTTTTTHHTQTHTTHHTPRSSPVLSSSRSPPAPRTPVQPPRPSSLASPRSHIDPWSAVDSAREGTLASPRHARHASTAHSSVSPRLPPALHVVKYETGVDDGDDGDGDEEIYYDVEKARAAPSHRHRSRRRSAKYHVPWISFHLSLLAPLVSLGVCLYAAIVTPCLFVAAPVLMILHRARPGPVNSARSEKQPTATKCSLRGLISRALAPALHLQLHLIYSSQCNKYHYHHHQNTRKHAVVQTKQHHCPGTRDKHLSVSTAASSHTAGSSSPTHHHHFTSPAARQHAPPSARADYSPQPLRMLLITLLSPFPALVVAVGSWTCSLFWLLSSILDTQSPQQGPKWRGCFAASSRGGSSSSISAVGRSRSRQASTGDLFPAVVAGPSSGGKEGSDGRQAILAVRRAWERWLLLGW